MEMKILLQTVFGEEDHAILEDYKDELMQETLELNIKREKTLSYILIATILALLCMDIYSSHLWTRDIHIFGRFSGFHVMLLAVSVIFLKLTYSIKEIERKCENICFLHNLYIGSITMFCALIAVQNMVIYKKPYPYIIAMFCTASVIMLSRKERLLVYSPPYFAYVIGAILDSNFFYDQLGEIFFSTLLLALALFVSGANYSLYTGNFIKNKIILGKTQELNNLNRAIDDDLKKRTEELNKIVEYDKLRTTFFANISHELRTPLAIIFSAQQMINYQLDGLKANGNQQNMEQYGNIIRQNCYRLIRIISNLIDITKIDANYMTLNLDNADIVKTVEDITLSVARFMQDKGMDITFDTDVEEAVIACDPDKIERVMLNLLSNAVKFTPKGGSMYVNMYNTVNEIEIHVKDTGIGIPEEMINLVFERFVQVDGTTSKAKEGSGIGLSLVKSIVEMHDGRIALVSKQNEGSEFIISLPKRTVPQAEGRRNKGPVLEKDSIEMINIEFSDIYF